MPLLYDNHLLAVDYVNAAMRGVLLHAIQIEYAAGGFHPQVDGFYAVGVFLADYEWESACIYAGGELQIGAVRQTSISKTELYKLVFVA